jgi:hypothetical protein
MRRRLREALRPPSPNELASYRKPELCHPNLQEGSCAARRRRQAPGAVVRYDDAFYSPLTDSSSLPMLASLRR